MIFCRVINFFWSMFFRLFPCPTPVRLIKVGNPDDKSPVLATCNFYITVQRLLKALEGRDVWLLVAQSGGVNVWCAAGGDEFNTESIVSAVKTSGINKLVSHRELILPPLGGPGISASRVREKTGWKVRWGPVRDIDIPLYLDQGKRRTEAMKRVTYDWKERLDTALGSLFPFYMLGGIGFLIIGPELFWNYIIIGALAFVFFMLAAPWLPGKTGIKKAMLLDIGLFIPLLILWDQGLLSGNSIGANIIIFMVMLLVDGAELGGLASTMPSDLDPFLSRLGIGNVGNVALAGTVRTELLNGYRELYYEHGKCRGCKSCTEICPQGVWEMGADKKAVFAKREKCTACRACLKQCDTGAITARALPGFAGESPKV